MIMKLLTDYFETRNISHSFQEKNIYFGKRIIHQNHLQFDFLTDFVDNCIILKNLDVFKRFRRFKRLRSYLDFSIM